MLSMMSPRAQPVKITLPCWKPTSWDGFRTEGGQKRNRSESVGEGRRRSSDTHVNLIELAKVHGVEAVDGRPDVLAVGALLHQLQLPHAGDVGQPGLDLRHVGDLRESGAFTSQTAQTQPQLIHLYESVLL